jgi:gliding motility-associated-like protein
VPNIITPNNDGKNDFLKIENIEQYPNNSVQIFNRWGQEIYSQDGYNNSDKKFVANDVPDGSYFILVNLGDSTKDPINNTLTITR